MSPGRTSQPAAKVPWSTRKKWTVSILGATAIWFSLFPPLHFSRSFSFTVVDADSGQPLAGVNAVAIWSMKGGIEGGNSFGPLKVVESVSDQFGQMQFPAWGPAFPNLKQLDAALHNGEPGIDLFKSGYKLEHIYNVGKLVGQAPLVLSFWWDGKTVKMHRFVGSAEEYAENLHFLSDDLQYQTCEWESIPRMITALREQYSMLKAEGVQFDVGIHRGLPAGPNEC